MIRTATETQDQTLTRLIRAMDAKQPVTVTYIKGDGTETVRTIELYDITISAAGDILLKAMDRETQAARTFRLDRIKAYSVHRSSYTVERADEPTTATMPSLRRAEATVAGLDLIPLDVEARIEQLADELTEAA